jgi:hypothetical protein
MSVDGKFDVTIHAPQGDQPMTIVLTTDGATITGTAESAEGVADLVEPSYQGNDVKWKLPITLPMPLTLEFEATVDGDSISGVAKVGAMATIPFDGSRV